jgi:hypothetical protein
MITLAGSRVLTREHPEPVVAIVVMRQDSGAWGKISRVVT